MGVLDDTAGMKKIDAKSIIALLAFVGSVVSGVILIDDRYAHADDVTKQTTELSTLLEINRLTGEINILQLRHSTLEDKVYDNSIRLAGKKSTPGSPDSVIQKRYESELDRINGELAKKAELIDSLKTKALNTTLVKSGHK